MLWAQCWCAIGKLTPISLLICLASYMKKFVLFWPNGYPWMGFRQGRSQTSDNEQEHFRLRCHPILYTCLRNIQGVARPSLSLGVKTGYIAFNLKPVSMSYISIIVLLPLRARSGSSRQWRGGWLHFGTTRRRKMHCTFFQRAWQ